MTQETIIYCAHFVIGAIVASLLTKKWRAHGKTRNELFWMAAAWVMTAADLLFAMRANLPFWVGKAFPPVLVTIGAVLLYIGARRTAKRDGWRRRAVFLVVVHALGVVYLLNNPELGSWRMVWNSLFWMGLSLSTCCVLRKAHPVFHKGWLSPAVVFLVHGIFLGLRAAAAALRSVEGWSEITLWLQVTGDLEVSFFMVALFVSLLIAHLELRHEELQQALVEVKTLSGLLPICAWCNKVRNDSGYWQRVEVYFSSRSDLKFTHGICADCAEDQHREISRANDE